jgi:hypothetical protein
MIKLIQRNKRLFLILNVLFILLAPFYFAPLTVNAAGPSVGPGVPVSGPSPSEGHWCGNLQKDGGGFDREANYKTKFNFGCLGKDGPKGLGPIQDLLFALIRFASIGVGIAVTISLIIAGIQYSTAEGVPEATQKAKLRAQQALIGLVIYIFAFSLLQYLIPGGLFKPGSWLLYPFFMIKLGLVP